MKRNTEKELCPASCRMREWERLLESSGCAADKRGSPEGNLNKNNPKFKQI
jgi:hypothetical protein